jgi:hypothetical protein
MHGWAKFSGRPHKSNEVQAIDAGRWERFPDEYGLERHLNAYADARAAYENA